MELADAALHHSILPAEQERHLAQALQLARLGGRAYLEVQCLDRLPAAGQRPLPQATRRLPCTSARLPGKRAIRGHVRPHAGTLGHCRGAPRNPRRRRKPCKSADSGPSGGPLHYPRTGHGCTRFVPGSRARVAWKGKHPANGLKPTPGLEPGTPSLRVSRCCHHQSLRGTSGHSSR
jgi:hypothetical protein